MPGFLASLASPLHPAVVHIPIALAVLMPLLAAAALVAGWRGWLQGRRVWVALVALQALLAVSSVVALRTGQGEEERVERVVSEQAIHAHEEAAEVFAWSTAIVLLLAALALLPRGERSRRALAAAALVGTLVVLGLGFRVGQAGGELVYKHGAAAAYAKGADAAAAGEAAGGERGGGGDDAD